MSYSISGDNIHEDSLHKITSLPESAEIEFDSLHEMSYSIFK